jgi:hypothetical protein
MSDTNTKVLLHFNGYNGSTCIDDFGSLKTWTAGGTASLVIRTKKFGRSCLYLDGDTGYIYTADHGDFTLGLADFSFDFWLKLPILTDSTPKCIFSKYQDTNNRYYLELYSNSGVQTMRFRSREGATLLNDASFAIETFEVDTWYHFELTRSGTTLYLFQNGTLLSTVSGALEISDLTGNFEIGRNGTSGYLNAYIDEFRYTYGTARHTSGFTTETYAYKRSGVDDEFTAALLHFNGAHGSTTITDAVGAAWTASNATIATDIKKLGNGSVDCVNPGNNPYVYPTTFPPRLALWHRDCFTIDFWYRPATIGVSGALLKIGNLLFYTDADTVSIKTAHGGTTIFTMAAAFTTATWYHIAFVKNGVNCTMYRDGVVVGTTDMSALIADQDTVAERATSSYYAGYIDGWSNNGGNGYYDELRISPDIQRWTADFSDSVPSDEYGITIKSAELTFEATADAAFDTLWDDVDPQAAAVATFFGQAMFVKELTESAEVTDGFTGQYWRDKSFTDSAVSDIEFTAGYYQTWSLPASAEAAFDGNYVVFIDVPAMNTPIPSLQGRCGYNCWAEPSLFLPTLEATTGAICDKTLQLPTLSSSAFVSISGLLSTRTPSLSLSATIDMGMSATVAKTMKLPSIDAFAYIGGSNTLSENMPLPVIYANAIICDSRSFSTYVLEYTR